MKIIEISERNETFRVLLKPEIFRSFKTYIEQLEHVVEQLQLDALFARREVNMQFTTGDDLKQKAMERFHARKDLFRSVMGDDK